MLQSRIATANATLHNGVTPLWIAAQNGHTEVVKLLLANKADVNARRGLWIFGEKPIDAARRNHHSDIIELLQ